MARLLVHVEGQTEETFVNEVLCDHLMHNGYESVSARIVGNARLRQRRGGIRPWPSVQKEIIRHLQQDSSCIATTMVDFYGLPQEGDAAWPGRAGTANCPTEQKASRVENALLNDIRQKMGSSFNPARFVPFVVMHEFEGLLFSDCAKFAQGIARMDLENSFKEIRNDFATPEDINDSPVTAPSKRVIALVTGYEKPLLGTLAALQIGLERIRGECPHFYSWLKKLEALAKSNY